MAEVSLVKLPSWATVDQDLCHHMASGITKPQWVKDYQPDCRTVHYSDVIINAMASQIISLTIVYSTRHRSRKTPKLRVTDLCARNSPETGEFSAQRASNAENVSIWWRHHGQSWFRERFIDAIWYQRSWSISIKVMAWHLFCTKPVI